MIGAQRYERTPHRTNRRNGTRPKTVATTAGEVELAIPKLRTGSFFPSLLHPRRRVDKAQMRRDLLRVDRGGLHPQGLATSCGPWATSPASAAPRSQGSATGIDEGVKEFLARSLDHTWFPHLFAGRHLPGREGGPEGGLPGAGGGHRRVGRRASGDPGHGPGGRRDGRLLDVLVLRSLRERGLKVPSPEDPTGVVLVTSDAHAGIRAAVRAILPGASWQRCRAPLRPQHHLPAGLGPIRARGRPGLHDLRPDQSGGRGGPVPARHRRLEGRLPFRIAQMLIDAEPDLTAFAAFPREHWTKIRPQQPHRAPQPRDQAPSRRRPGVPRQRVRTPPDRIRPVRATRSGSTANAATCPRPHCDT